MNATGLFSDRFAHARDLTASATLASTVSTLMPDAARLRRAVSAASAFMSFTQTLAPDDASCGLMLSPNPRLPPVTRAIPPVNAIFISRGPGNQPLSGREDGAWPRGPAMAAAKHGQED